MRTATQALHSGHPVVMSACWYLDYNQEWSSYLAVDLTASARASVLEGSKYNRAHSRGGSRGNNQGRNGRVNNREPRHLRSTEFSLNTSTINTANDTTVQNTTAVVDVHANLNYAQRMYLSLTELEEEETGAVYNESTGARYVHKYRKICVCYVIFYLVQLQFIPYRVFGVYQFNPIHMYVLYSEPSAAGPALHSNYFIPGGEASMWTERVDCANLECRYILCTII